MLHSIGPTHAAALSKFACIVIMPKISLRVPTIKSDNERYDVKDGEMLGYVYGGCCCQSNNRNLDTLRLISGYICLIIEVYESSIHNYTACLHN
jgi:hypothetical protein